MMMGLRWLGAGSGGSAAGAVVLGNLMAFAVALPFALPLAAGPADAALLVYLGVFQIGIAYPLLLRALRHVSAIEASLLLFVEPVLSPVWAFLVHGERPGRVGDRRRRAHPRRHRGQDRARRARGAGGGGAA